MISNSIKNNFIKFIYKTNKLNINSLYYYSTTLNNNENYDNSQINDNNQNNNYNKINYSFNKNYNNYNQKKINYNKNNYEKKHFDHKSRNQFNKFNHPDENDKIQENEKSINSVLDMTKYEENFKINENKQIEDFRYMINGYLKNENLGKAMKYLYKSLKHFSNQKDQTSILDVESACSILLLASKQNQSKYIHQIYNLFKEYASNSMIKFYESFFESLVSKKIKRNYIFERYLRLLTKDVPLKEFNEQLFNNFIYLLDLCKLRYKVYQFYKSFSETKDLSMVLEKFTLIRWVIPVMHSFVYIELYDCLSQKKKSNLNPEELFKEIQSFWKFFKKVQFRKHLKENQIIGPDSYLHTVFFSYLSTLNKFIQYKILSVEQIKTPFYIESYLNDVFSNNKKVLSKNINNYNNGNFQLIDNYKKQVELSNYFRYSNQMIAWHLSNNDIETAKQIFHEMIKHRRTDIYSYFYIFSWLTIQYDGEELHSSIKEIISTDDYKRVFDYGPNNRDPKQFVWKKVIKLLLLNNKEAHIPTLLKLIHSYNLCKVTDLDNFIDLEQTKKDGNVEANEIVIEEIELDDFELNETESDEISSF